MSDREIKRRSKYTSETSINTRDVAQHLWKMHVYYTFLIIYQHRWLIFSIPLVGALRMLLRFFSPSRYDNKTFKLC